MPLGPAVHDRGVYPPWVVESPRWSGGSWHGTCIMPITSRCVGARRNDQSPNNYWGCKAPKNWRRRGGKNEQFEIYHYSPWAQTMQWLKWFINTIQSAPAIFLHFGLKLSNLVHINQSTYRLPSNSLKFFLTMVIMLLNRIFNYSHGGCPNFQGPKSPNCGIVRCKRDALFKYR